MASLWLVGFCRLEDSTLLTEPPERPDDYKENKGIAAGYKPPKEYEQYIPTKEQTATIPHLASPEVIVDELEQTLTLYFHGLVGYASQMTKMAVSKDGLSFTADSKVVAYPYFRVFEHNETGYALSMPGVIYQGSGKDYTAVKNIFDFSVRHSGVLVIDDYLYIFYSRVGDNPESILMSYVDLTVPPEQWSASEPQLILKPEKDWEGADLPLIASSRDAINTPVNQLRDPDVFVDDDQAYLLYSVRGENGIAIAKLHIMPD